MLTLFNNNNRYAAAVQLTSDSRFKNEIRSLTGNGIETIKKLEGVRYGWRQDEFPQRNFDNRTHSGFIAQEVEKVLPEAVQTGDDGYKSIAYYEIIPSLVEALKEQQTIIDELQKEVDDMRELKERVEHLEELVRSITEDV